MLYVSVVEEGKKAFPGIQFNSIYSVIPNACTTIIFKCLQYSYILMLGKLLAHSWILENHILVDSACFLRQNVLIAIFKLKVKSK